MYLLNDLNFTLPLTNPVIIFSLVLFIILFAPILFNKIKLPHIIGLILAGWFLSSAGAEETPAPVAQQVEHIALRLKEAEKAVEKRLLSERLGLHFYGYLEGSYTQNFNNPSNRINQLRIFDVNSNQFRPNLAQAVLEREAKADGSHWDRLGFRVKFNAGRDSAFIGGTNISTWADFQEYYVQYQAPIGRGLNLQAGQINSLVGYENGGEPAQRELLALVALWLRTTLHHTWGASFVRLQQASIVVGRSYCLHQLGSGGHRFRPAGGICARCLAV